MAMEQLTPGLEEERMLFALSVPPLPPHTHTLPLPSFSLFLSIPPSAFSLFLFLQRQKDKEVGID